MRRGGGLYSNFVSSTDDVNKPYRGAEIPPPSNLTGRLGGSGFSRNYSGVPPPSSLQTGGFRSSGSGVNKQGYSTIDTISNNPELLVRKARTEEDYFNDDDEDDHPTGDKKLAKDDDILPYQPAPGSPGAQEEPKKEDSDSEEDPLDAFMANLEKDAQKKGVKAVDKASSSKPISHGDGGSSSTSSKGVRTDIDEADDEESYYRWLEENPNAGRTEVDDDDEFVEYDADGNPIPVVGKSKHIDPLASIDHGSIDYKPFERNFYTEHGDISGLSPIQLIDLQQKLGIRVSGASPPKLVTSFAHFGFDEKLLKAIRKSEFTQPTPIQSQGIPALLSGRDVIGIAKTGSGKTAAFLWPMLVHIRAQSRLLKGDGPIGLVLVPTRELAMQIYSEAKKFGRVYDLSVVCAYGGGSKWEQSKAFEAGSEIAIATPGRMIDMIKMKVTNLQRVTYLVLDEADRMFDMGFEPQVRSICNHVRPDRQCMLFSATFKKKVERLARDSLTDPVKVVQGSIGEASEDVRQVVKVMDLGGAKWQWLLAKLVEFTSQGSVLVFVTKKANCEELAHNLKVKEFDLKVIHGDLMQHERNEIIAAFRKREFPILVATDVAARGLDIPHIRTVINFDLARDIETHTHRIGRTGRAGVKGTAYTLVTSKDTEMVGHLVRNLEQANQDVSKDLMDLAMKCSWFRNSRFRKGFKGNDKGGLGFKGEGKSDFLRSRDGIGLPSGSQGRLGTIKSTFKSQYLSRFCQSSDSVANSTNTISAEDLMRQQQSQTTAAASQVSPEMPPPPMPGQEGTSRKRKSRWE